MNKRTLFLVAVMVFALVASFALLQAGDKSMKAQTVEGVLIDTKCYSMGGFTTNDHKDMKGNKLPNCATACASMGIPVGVLTKDKKVYVIGLPAQGFAQLMAKEVRLVGMHGKFGADNIFLPEKLYVKENGKWVEKPLPKGMM
ncbi:MAG: hypothetical protein D6715_09025 [Calditrichaeota bacterium]|nr:MAG: hypothetical protein D6715_09025 [Calditrichota bacterium]